MSSSLGSAGASVRLAEYKRQLRVRSERVLRVVAMEKLAARYPDRVVPSKLSKDGLFWRWMFAPLYLRVGWPLKRRAMVALRMTSRGWAPDARRFGEPWRPPPPNGRSDSATTTARGRE